MLITARASGANYRWANPSRLLTQDLDGELSALIDGVDVVVVRILGGYRAWEDGIDAVLAAPAPERHLYVCGPNGFMEVVTHAAQRLGW